MLANSCALKLTESSSLWGLPPTIRSTYFLFILILRLFKTI
jgi:hypothetical protein